MSHRCDECRRLKDNVRLREKTDARTFKAVRASLCTPCARAGSWSDVTFERGHLRTFA
jgi:hypothetical protein